MWSRGFRRGPRGYGSALTYARRYGLAAILGLCIDVDDDAAPAGDVSEPASQGDAWPEYCPELGHRPSAADQPLGLEPPADAWRRRNGHGRAKAYRKQRQPPEPA